MKNAQSKPKAAAAIPDFAPSDLGTDAQRRFFDSSVQPKIDRNRWFFISIILAVALVIEGVAWTQIFPLKQVETYMAQKHEGGRIVVDENPIGKWEPDKDSIAYFLNQWTNNVFDINRSTLEKTLTEASSMTLGNAIAQLHEMRVSDNPIVLLRQYPNYNRSYEYKSINFIKDDVALLRFKTVERKNDAVNEVHYAMTITFTRVKPRNREQLIRNPAGIYINNFHLTQESSK